MDNCVSPYIWWETVVSVLFCQEGSAVGLATVPVLLLGGQLCCFSVKSESVSVVLLGG